MLTPDWDLDPDTAYGATPDGAAVGASPVWGGLTFTQTTGAGYGTATVQTVGDHKIVRSQTSKLAYFTSAITGARPETVALVVAPKGDITGVSGRNGAVLHYASTGINANAATGGPLALYWPSLDAGTAVTEDVQHVIVCVHTVSDWSVFLDGVKVMTQAEAGDLIAQVRLGICGDLYRAAAWDAAYTDDEVYDLSYELSNLYDPIPKVWDFDPLGVALAADVGDGDPLPAGTYDGVTFTGTGWVYDLLVGDTGKPGMVVTGPFSAATVGTITRAASSTTHVVAAWTWASVPISPTTIDLYEETGAAEEVHLAARLDDASSTWRATATVDNGVTPYACEGLTRNYAKGTVPQLITIVTTTGANTSIYLNGVLIGLRPPLTAAADIVCTLRNNGTGTAVTILRAYMVDSAQTVGDMEDLMAVYGITGGRSAVLAWDAPAHNGGATLEGYLIRYGFEGGIAEVSVGPTVVTATIALDATDTPIAVHAVNAQGPSKPAEIIATSYVPLVL